MERQEKIALLERLVKEGSITLEEAFKLMNEQVVVNREVTKQEPFQVQSPTIVPYWWQYQVSGGTSTNTDWYSRPFWMI